MTIASQSPEQETHVSAGVAGVQGRSPSQIAWGRLRRDRVGMISLGMVMLYVVVALLAPVITRLLGVDTKYHTDLIGDGGMPKGDTWPHAAISTQHLLGIEPRPAATSWPSCSTAAASRCWSPSPRPC